MYLFSEILFLPVAKAFFRESMMILQNKE